MSGSLCVCWVLCSSVAAARVRIVAARGDFHTTEVSGLRQSRSVIRTVLVAHVRKLTDEDVQGEQFVMRCALLSALRKIFLGITENFPIDLVASRDLAVGVFQAAFLDKIAVCPVLWSRNSGKVFLCDCDESSRCLKQTRRLLFKESWMEHAASSWVDISVEPSHRMQCLCDRVRTARRNNERIRGSPEHRGLKDRILARAQRLIVAFVLLRHDESPFV